jgi:XTP/dITP diphosphohydrolase
MSARLRLVVASLNRGKCLEIARLLERHEILSLSDFDPVDFPDEGSDYHENARQKALVAARAIGLPCIADDSGLEVDCLGGAPGPFSARFGGPGLDDRGRILHLLERLASRPRPWRARFFCVAACAFPEGRVEIAEGVCEGEILASPRGEGGFGYDPIFRVEGGGGAMAELEPREKDKISHRARALQTLDRKLGLVASG